MLNLFNRLLVVLGFLILLLATLLFVVVPGPILDLIIPALSNLHEALQEDIQARAVTVLVGLGFALVWFLLLILEVWRPPARAARVQKVSGGEIEITLESVAQRLEYRLDQMPDVVKVYPKVSAARNGVNLFLEVETGPDVEVPSKTEQILAAAKEEVEERMGVRINKVRVSLRQAPRPR